MKDDPISDSILVERFQNGDIEAMDKLIKKHQTRAYRFAFRLTNEREMASDVVSDAFVRMYRSAHSFKGQSSFTTWMYRIITNCFLDIRKRSNRRPALSLEVATFGQDSVAERFFETSASNPQSALESSERHRSIESRLKELPEFQRIMILLFHQEMLSYEQMAETLDLPIGTVKSRLNRARFNLRTALNPELSLFDQDGQLAA